MATPKTIDAVAFERAFQAALPNASKVMKAKVDDKAAKGLPMQAAMLDINSLSASGVQETFCKNWPRIETFLNFAIGAVGWWMPAQAALAKAFIAAMKSTVLPLVCPVPPAE